MVAVTNQQPTALSLASQMANRVLLCRATACSLLLDEIDNGALKQYSMTREARSAATDKAVYLSSSSPWTCSGRQGPRLAREA